MGKQDGEYDYHRYRQLLAEASDERKRLALIALLMRRKPGTAWPPNALPIAQQ